MLTPAMKRSEGAYLALEANLPSPSILYMGSAVPLRLFIQKQPRASSGAASPLAIKSLSLTISLKMETTITTGPHKSTWATAKELVSIPEFCLPLFGEPLQELTEVPSDLWKDITLTDLPPSFTTCTVRRQYSLIIAAVFDYESNKTVDVRAGIYLVLADERWLTLIYRYSGL